MILTSSDEVRVCLTTFVLMELNYANIMNNKVYVRCLLTRVISCISHCFNNNNNITHDN